MRIDNAVHQFLDFLVELEDITAQRPFDLVYLGESLVPLAFEDDADIVEQHFGGLQALEDGFKLAFNHIAADGFAVAFTALVEAQIVRVLLARLALGPAGCRC
ncbi:MAG: hypothetical protein AAF590_01205 [Pseudomonadota bacterium]